MSENKDFKKLAESLVCFNGSVGALYPLMQFGGGLSGSNEALNEEQLKEEYTKCVAILKQIFGAPVYEGTGPRINSSNKRPNALFSYYVSAIKCSWWCVYQNEKDIEIMLYHTGHDADSLQYLYLEVSYV